jgi:hypothetical protein
VFPDILDKKTKSDRQEQHKKFKEVVLPSVTGGFVQFVRMCFHVSWLFLVACIWMNGSFSPSDWNLRFSGYL